jgi:hypothetical protein
MQPGTGNVNFVEMFCLIEGAGFAEPYTCGWGTVDQMFEGRKYVVEKACEAGVT